MKPGLKAKSEVSTESGRSPSAGKFKRFFILILSLTIVVLAVVLSLRAWDYNERHPRTDDAISRANIIGIAPRVSGPIIKLNVSDNQFVKGGDLLFEIDPADFQLQVDQAKSALDALDQQIEVAKTQDAQLKFQIKLRKRVSSRPPRSEIRPRTHYIVWNRCYQKLSQPRSKLTRHVPRSLPLTLMSLKQMKSSTRRASPSVHWPRSERSVLARLQLWVRRS
jgi:multidrug resistance efflux pump